MKKKTSKQRVGRPFTGGRTYVTRSISMEPDFKEKAEARARELGFSNFSEYARRIIERDLHHGGPIVIERQRLGGS